MRSSRNFDFAAPFVASGRMIARTDPYNIEHFHRDWHAMGAAADQTTDDSGSRPVYPPFTLSAIAPLTALRWPAALATVVWLSWAGYLVLVAYLSLQIPAARNNWRRYTFALGALLFTPVHTGLATGNLSIPAFLACALAVLILSESRDFRAGLLLTLACALKPTLGFTLCIYLLVAKRGRALKSFAAASAGLALATIAWMSRVPAIWKQHYRENVAYVFGPKGAATFEPSNANRFQLCNLAVPFNELLHRPHLAQALALLVFLTLGCLWIRAFTRYDRLLEKQNAMLTLASIAVLCLLPVYQRSYSTGLLLLGAVALFQHLSMRAAKVGLIASTWFLIPGEEILRRKIGPHQPHPLTNSRLWNAGIMSLNSWVILVIAVSLILTMYSVGKLRQEEVAENEEQDSLLLVS